jgi:hypothetical protein
MTQRVSPLVSVVMAVYNGDRFLRQAIDSILTQSFTDFELIVIDDASTDGTPQILDSYSDSRIVRLTNRQNIGQTRSLNKGLAVSRGAFIARHDADDISHPNRLQEQVAYMMANPALGLLGTDYHIIDENGQILETNILPVTNDELNTRLLEGNIFCHGSVIMKKEMVDKVGGYHEGFRVTQDFDLWLRLAEHGEIANLARPLYQFRFDSNSVSRKKRGLQLAYGQLALKLALQRRASQPEDPVPNDVLSVYPPEPGRLFADARRSAYLYYAAGQEAEAATILRQAREYLLQVPGEVSSWSDWACSQARVLADLRNNPAAGVEFISWVFVTLPIENGKKVAQQTISRFLADQAFLAFANKQRVLPLAVQAVRYDRRWLGNKGLWVITWRSLWSQ